MSYPTKNLKLAHLLLRGR